MCEMVSFYARAQDGGIVTGFMKSVAYIDFAKEIALMSNVEN